MGMALEQAEQALRSGEVPVGCVFVDGDLGSVLAVGHNVTNQSMNATRHAELVAIDDLLLHQRASVSVLQGCCLFVTCEPCIQCAAALAAVGVQKVYFGCHNDRFGGNGSILAVHEGKYEVEAGVLRGAAVEVFQRFYERENRRAPEAKRRKKQQS